MRQTVRYPQLIRPSNEPSSHRSPRKLKFSTLERLSAPRLRLDNNRNPQVNEFGEREVFLSEEETFYAELFDDIADQVYVPKHMRHKMIYAIMETEKPSLYRALTKYNKHFMKPSKTSLSRSRMKAVMLKPSAISGGKQNVFKDLCVQDQIRAKQEFTDKFVQVMVVLQANQEKEYQLDLQTKAKEKASLRSVHVKVVVANFFGVVLNRATRNIVRRERNLYEERQVLLKKQVLAKKKIMNAWHRYVAFVDAKSIVAKLKNDKVLRLERERNEEQLFLKLIETRMMQEKASLAAWHSKNPHVSLKSYRSTTNMVPSEESEFEQRLETNRHTELSISSKNPHLEAKIDALMEKYGKSSIVDGISRRKRFFDVRL